MTKNKQQKVNKAVVWNVLSSYTYTEAENT
jgi:hypothetical protein